jgi:ADP-dependent NAD(P)H-hydrate dehydratase / NAD(P)H-hydrate epimerase
MRIVTTDEMRAIDRSTSERFGVPSLTLMENAGTAVAQVAMREFPAARHFLVICGKGNNGGDGFVAARKLKEAGREVGVVQLAKADDLHGDAAEMLKRMALPFVSIDCSDDMQRELIPALAKADVFLDAILGSGFRPPVRGLYAEAIEAINRAEAPVISVDVPSGADSDSVARQTDPSIARSNVIVTFTAPRPAHVFGRLTDGPLFCAPIGSPDEAVVSELKLNLITPADIAGLFAPRDPDGHKGLYGHALVFGGSVGKAGAAAMAGLAALRSGAGLSTVATPQSALPMVAGFAFELMTEPLEENEKGAIAASAMGYGRFDEIVAGKDVIAYGPGISRHQQTVQFVRWAVAKSTVPLVIDADGLNAFEGKAALLDGSSRPLVLTPHPGEMSRLTGLSTKDIQANRIEVARKFAREHKLIVVLKGHRTLVALPDETVWVNPTGNPGMATGGTGDVLTGMITGLIAQHRDEIPRAVIAAVYLHGLAGDIAREKFGEQCMIAGDVLAALPEAIRRVKASAQQLMIRIS